MSEVVNINPSQALDSIIGTPMDGPTEDRIEQQAMGQADFFKLLTTQLASQDPLSPMEDTAFIAQMAQFSALEMQSRLNTNFSNFTASQQFQSAQNLIGKNVTMLIEGQEVSGLAEGIEMVDGTTRVFVDGRGYNMDSVFKIEAIEGPTQMTPADVLELVGSVVNPISEDEDSVEDDTPGEAAGSEDPQPLYSSVKQAEAVL